MKPICANSIDDLLIDLGRIDISVPLRTEGRTTDHCEKWSICRFLATFANTDILKFPIELTHQNRPDFILQHAIGDVGVEATEVVPENDAAINAYREHHEIEGPFFLKRHRPGEPRLNAAELKNQATSNKSGDVWGGYSVEREWVQAMRAFIFEKVEKAAKPGFQLFAENWLLMYDNWSLPVLDREVVTEMLFNSISKEEFGPFQRIFVESSKHIWSFSPTEYNLESINDLWASS